MELIKCRDDIEYFADNYIKISIRSDIEQIKMNYFQRKVIQNYKDKRVFYELSERMTGKTTVAAIILLHQALFNEYRASIIFARTLSMSNCILDQIKMMYDMLPDFLTGTKMIIRNKTKIEFDNMCSIISAGSSVNQGKGRALSTIYIDESEWFDNLDEVVTSLYPCMASSQQSKLFALTSTRTQDTFRKFDLSVDK